ncbi:MAG: hypothetical protein HXX14_14920 [Bacteroidetes bacterium]|nr:hypothetical protein [Bacteroidota bacterium]
MRKLSLFLLLITFYIQAFSQQQRWSLSGENEIIWKIKNENIPHSDHIEMSGEGISAWLQYGIDTTGKLQIARTLVFPAFRTVPNDTHGSLMYTFSDNDLPRFFINQSPWKASTFNGRRTSDQLEQINKILLNGSLEIESRTAPDRRKMNSALHDKVSGSNEQIMYTVDVKRKLFPSPDKPLFVEKFVFRNISEQPVRITMEALHREIMLDTAITVNGPHRIIESTINDGTVSLKPKDSVVFAVVYYALHAAQNIPEINISTEENARRLRISDILSHLQLMTPDTVLNTAFNFAKIRTTESIYATKNGLMHGPGGLSYYAAIWANDQAEYANPFFAFLGDDVANNAVMNSFRLFAKYMNPAFKPIPSSIVAEGTDFWNGAGDRGDQAMIAYGASRFALANGNIDSAKILWPLIEWCLAYSKRHLNTEGVVSSDCDELEGRFPAGSANLCTSSLYYDALISASMLGKVIGLPKTQTEAYNKDAKKLRIAIEKYFGGNVEGFETYRYFKENTILRSWICVPLTVGIFERKEATINALFSPRLWTEDGLATQAGDKTFWDRSTLYALRGVFSAGETEKALQYLKAYSSRRLLGNHVPYPVEAYPEGNQRHLAAESALYCRIYIEGLFGLRPTSFRTFSCTPRLPLAWPKMELKHIRAFQNDFDVTVERVKGKLKIFITSNKKIVREMLINEGDTISIQL